MNRLIVLDTETTGLEKDDGHRIIEIGAVEVLERQLTGRHFHEYINPEREVDEGAFEIHGISNEFLADKPLFTAVREAFVEFVDGATLVIHNAPFDVGFLNHEFRLDGYMTPLETHCEVVDSLVLARKTYPGQRNSLDALCKRLDIDNGHRTLHGALLDAEILADVYLRMTGGQESLLFDDAVAGDAPVAQIVGGSEGAGSLLVVEPTETELAAHNVWLDRLEQGGQCRWRNSGSEQT